MNENDFEDVPEKSVDRGQGREPQTPDGPAHERATASQRPSSTGSMPSQRPTQGARPSSTGQFGKQPTYVRPQRPRKTQPAITEPQNEKYPSDYTHDSGIAVGGGNPLSGASYRRSRAEVKRLRRDLHYGQYLEIPKGRRSIFASQERARRTRSVIALAVVVAILAIAAILVWRLMVSTFGL